MISSHEESPPRSRAGFRTIPLFGSSSVLCAGRAGYLFVALYTVVAVTGRIAGARLC